MTDTTTYPVPEVLPKPHDPGPTNVNSKPTRPDRDAYAAELATAVTDAEKELARDQKALDKAKAEVERLEDWVAFDQGRIESRTKSRDHFDRLRAKAAK